MGIKEFVNKKLNQIKENSQKKKELNEIKQKAYEEEMKKQYLHMGKKQAKIDAEIRERKYLAKEKRKLQNFEEDLKNNNQKDYFGLNKAIPGEYKII